MTDLGQLLDQLTTYLGRFVVLTRPQLVTLALWVFHTWALEAADCTPYLSVESAEKRSGKSRLLEALELIVREPLPTANISDAALFRSIAESQPSILLDEADAIWGPRARDREDLRGLVNAGYRRGAVVRRMGGKNNTTLEAFPVFSAKVFAGIGTPPDTVRDRSIVIRLKRRTADEPVERFRRRAADADAEPIRLTCESLAGYHVAALSDARPELPHALDDRAQDFWEPLFAIADLAAGEWPSAARSAALALSAGESREDDSLTALLLRDLNAIFQETEIARWKTSDLIAKLVEIEESPWGDFRGRTITPQALSKLLKPHQIRTMPVWVDGATVKGYKVEMFRDAFARVLGVRGVREVSSEAGSQAAPNPPNPPNPHPREGCLGHPLYPLTLAEAGNAGLITDTEFERLLALHKLVDQSLNAEIAA